MVLVAAAALLQWAAALDCNCSGAACEPARVRLVNYWRRDGDRVRPKRPAKPKLEPGAGRAERRQHEDACATSAGLVACLDPYLARPWRAVHVNYGREDARRNVSTADYAQNLETLRDMLLARTTWKLTWASSVPRGVPDVRRLDAPRARLRAERVVRRPLRRPGHELPAGKRVGLPGDGRLPAAQRGDGR